MASAWPEPPSGRPADNTAGVRDGVEALAFSITETPTEPSRGGAEKGVSPATSPRSFEEKETYRGLLRLWRAVQALRNAPRAYGTLWDRLAFRIPFHLTPFQQ
jgi:hypothetical protein